MQLDQLLSKRLILLSGKGGVGKTTVAVCLGLLASHLNKNTLIVEMNSTERVAPYFGLKEIGHAEVPLSPYLAGINLNVKECFEEYVLMQIHFKRIFDTFINNRFVTSFLNAVPGLNELLMLGKIYDLERQTKKRKKSQPLYDLIIVDGPATGHGVSSFEVPFVVNRAVRVGPMRHQSEKLIKMMTDPERTAFCVATLAEEMPVAESTELIQTVRQKLKLPLGPLFVNNYQKPPFSDDEEKELNKNFPAENNSLYPYFAYANLASQRAQLHRHYLDEIRKRNSEMTLIKIPHLTGNIDTAEKLMPIVRGWMGARDA